MENTANQQTVILGSVISARFMKFVVKSEVNGKTFASIGELNIVQ